MCQVENGPIRPFWDDPEGVVEGGSELPRIIDDASVSIFSDGQTNGALPARRLCHADLAMKQLLKWTGVS